LNEKSEPKRGSVGFETNLKAPNLFCDLFVLNPTLPRFGSDFIQGS